MSDPSLSDDVEEEEEVVVEESDPGALQPFFSDDQMADAFNDLGPDDSDETVEPDVDPDDDGFDDDDDDDGFDDDEPVADPTPEPVAATTGDVLEFGGRSYLRSDVEAQLAWASGLTPEQVARIAQAIEYDQQAPQQQQQQAPQPQPQPVQGFDIEDTVDPDLARYMEGQFATQQAEIEQLKAQQYAVYQQEQAREEQVLTESFMVKRQEIADRYQLSELEVQALTTTMENSNIITFLAEQMGIANPDALFDRAYEQTYWTVPAFRDRTIQSETAHAVEAEREQTQKVADRKARAGALTGGGGGTPSSLKPAAPVPATAADRQKMLVDGFAKAMAEGR
jgi:hypothetical protein